MLVLSSVSESSQQIKSNLTPEYILKACMCRQCRMCFAPRLASGRPKSLELFLEKCYVHSTLSKVLCLTLHFSSLWRDVSRLLDLLTHWNSTYMQIGDETLQHEVIGSLLG